MLPRRGQLGHAGSVWGCERRKRQEFVDGRPRQRLARWARGAAKRIPPGHLQAVGERSRAARQECGGGATSVAPAAAPVRGRGAFCDEQSTPTRDCPAPGHRPGRPAAGGRSGADGKRCSGARRADRDNSSVLRRVARRGAGQPRECGAVAGIGGGCGQNRGACAPLLRLTRRSVRRQGTHQVPAPAPKWRPASPARRRRHGSHPPRRRTRTWAPQ